MDPHRKLRTPKPYPSEAAAEKVHDTKRFRDLVVMAVDEMVKKEARKPDGLYAKTVRRIGPYSSKASASSSAHKSLPRYAKDFPGTFDYSIEAHSDGSGRAFIFFHYMPTEAEIREARAVGEGSDV